MTPDNGLLTITAAYTGLRWGELAGLQWSRTYLGEDPRIHVDRGCGALHEIRGRLELGPPKSPASVRVVQCVDSSGGLSRKVTRTISATVPSGSHDLHYNQGGRCFVERFAGAECSFDLATKDMKSSIRVRK